MSQLTNNKIRVQIREIKKEIENDHPFLSYISQYMTDSQDPDLQSKQNLYFIGNAGTGKTHLVILWQNCLHRVKSHK